MCTKYLDKFSLRVSDTKPQANVCLNYILNNTRSTIKRHPEKCWRKMPYKSYQSIFMFVYNSHLLLVVQLSSISVSFNNAIMYDWMKMSLNVYFVERLKYLECVPFCILHLFNSIFPLNKFPLSFVNSSCVVTMLIWMKFAAMIQRPYI